MRYQLPMFIVLFHLCLDQIFHKLFKIRVWISFLPFPPSQDTNGSAVRFTDRIFFHGENVSVGGNNPGEGMSADHKGCHVSELVDVGQFPCPLPYNHMGMGIITIACILDVGNKDLGE